MSNLIIGIDPDITKNGVAILDREKMHIQTKSLSFFELFDFLKENRETIKQVKVECGFLNKKSNWHFAKNNRIMEKIAKNVGENHSTAKHIIQMCEYVKVDYAMKLPIKKVWKGLNGKITQPEVEIQLARLKITHTGTKNQDARDSILIALY